jgi:hypothetical protein
LAPFGEKTKDFEWRNSIQKGDYIDVLTMSKSWVLARVKEVKKKKIFVPYRQDHNKGGGLFGAGNKQNSQEENVEPGVGDTQSGDNQYEDNEDGFWSKKYLKNLINR